MSTTRQINVHQDHNLNEIRNVSFEVLPALPAVPGKQGRFVQVANVVYYGDTAATWSVFVSGAALSAAPRFVGQLDVSTGTVSLVTPLVDTNDGTNTWSAGDFGVVAVGGTLAPAPSFGAAVVSPGDQVICIQGPAVDNASFMVVERNQSVDPTIAKGYTQLLVPGDWATVPGGFKASVNFSSAFNQLLSFTVVNTTTSEVETFGATTSVGDLGLFSTAVPADNYLVTVVGL